MSGGVARPLRGRAEYEREREWCITEIEGELHQQMTLSSLSATRWNLK